MMRPATRVCAPSALVVLLAMTVSAGSSCGGDDECEFDRVLRDIGGAGLIDCGIADFQDTAEVDACAVEAHAANQTFRAIYEQEDGELQGIVHASGDSYHLVTLAADGRTIARAECEDGLYTQAGARTYINCVDPGPFRTVCE